MNNRELDPMLISKLPLDIIINHLIPYTYNVNPKRHLVDIRSFYRDNNFIYNLYFTEFNHYILLYDLLSFCNGGKPLIYGIHYNFVLILKRTFMMKQGSREDIEDYIFNNYLDERMNKNITEKIKMLFGLLTCKERTAFINFHIDDFID
jgi:hypothetical protein